MKAFPIISARRLSSASGGCLRVEGRSPRSAQLVVIATGGVAHVRWVGVAPSHLLSTAR